MKRLLAILCAALLPALSMLAIPARPGAVIVQQPDGTTLSIRLVGDEYLHFNTTDDGYTIIKNADGYYVYAELQGDDLVVTTRRAHDERLRTEDERAWLENTGKHLLPKMSDKAMRRRDTCRALRRNTQARISSPLRCIDYSNFCGLVILVEFNDCKFSRADYAQIADKMWNETNYKGYDDPNYGQFTGSVHDYFRDNSNGIFAPHFDIVGPVAINHSQYDAIGSDNVMPLIVDAIRAADPIVDYSLYDKTGDKEVDALFFVFAGHASSYGGDDRLIWPHQSYISNPDPDSDEAMVVCDGVTLWNYACSTELMGVSSTILEGISTICHEFSHVLGLHDLYDTDYGKNGQSNDPSTWSIMAGGELNYGRTPVGYGLYERYTLGFTTPETLKADSHYSLKSICSSNSGYRIDSEVPNEFFLLENRQKTDKWDAWLPGHGLLVFRVDSTDITPWSFNEVNADAARNYYELVRASGGLGAKASDPFPGSNNVTSLTNTTEPANLLSWSGKPTRMVLEDIAEDSNGTVSFRVVDTQKEPGTPDTPTLGSYTVKYWFDEQQALAGTMSDVHSALQLDVSALSDGLHALHIMVCNTAEYANPFTDGTRNEYFEEAPHTVYFEKHGDEMQVRNLYFIDDELQAQQNIYNADKTYNLAIPVLNVSEGLHRLTSMVMTREGLRPVIGNGYFQRMPTTSELDGLRLSVSIDGVAPTTLQRGFENGSLAYDLDVSKMPSGLHDLTYQVKGVLQTTPKKEFFVIDPKVNGYDYWLNGDVSTAVHTDIAPAATPCELTFDVPVRSMPLRSDNFRFNVEEGIPVTYAVNDFTFQTVTDNGYWDNFTTQYLDTQSRKPVNSTLLPKNESVTEAAPAAGTLKWFNLKADRGNIIGLKTSRPCTIQLFSPEAQEIYTAKGSSATTAGECQAPTNGIYYLAMHDTNDNLGQADITVSYINTVGTLPELKGDVNFDGSVDVADIATIISYMAGQSTSASAGMVDVNGDDVVDVADIATVISIMAALARLSESLED